MRILLWLCLLLASLCIQGCASLESVNSQLKRVALVIGNQNYQPKLHAENEVVFGPLLTPGKDANDMTSTLRQLGFEVYKHTDLNKEKMKRAIEIFVNRLGKETIGLIYFSGHGLASEDDKEAYLIPVGMNPLPSPLQTDVLEGETITRSYIYEKLNKAGNRRNIIILDACRDTGSSNDQGDKGVVAMLKGPQGEIPLIFGANSSTEKLPQGTIVAFATRQGQPAVAGGQGENSAYTKILLKFISKPGLSIQEVFDRIREKMPVQTPTVRYEDPNGFFKVPLAGPGSGGEVPKI